jgi:IS30 family transposase
MIDKAHEAEIVRLFYAEKWKVGTISSQLGVHHSTVRRASGAKAKRTVKSERFTNA